MPRLTWNSRSTILSTDMAEDTATPNVPDMSSDHASTSVEAPVVSTSIANHSSTSTTVPVATPGNPPQLVASASGSLSAVVLQPTRTTFAGMRVSQAPAFLPTFVPPSLAISQCLYPGSSSIFSSSAPLPATSTSSIPPSFLPITSTSTIQPSLGHAATSSTMPFVVGPGFNPIPHKMVQNIVGCQFVDLPILIQESSEDEPGTFTLLAGQLVINPGPRKVRQITDVVTWVQAFSIYASIFCAHYPHRARDLWLYQLFIVRIAKQFRGATWANYDKAFRRDAAARNITDWSQMNLELFNYHSATSRLDAFIQPRRPSTESRGSPSSQFICRSWNKGRCSCTLAMCRYRHVCDVVGCCRDHRGIEHNQSVNNENRPQFVRDRPAKRPYHRENFLQ